MPANVETAAYSNQPAWHREGVVLDTEGQKGMTIPVALKKSGLDWEVRKVPIFAYSDYQVDEDGVFLPEPTPAATVVEIPGRWGVQRTSDGRMFGAVGKTWHPTQNHEGFKVIDDVIDLASHGDGKAWIESAGALDGGKKVWILAHIENDWQIAGEEYNQYMLFVNGFDGRTSVTMATTNVRVVCQNTLSMALEGTNRVVHVRHTKNAADRIKEAVHMLEMRNQYTEQLAIQGEYLAESNISEGEFEQFLASLMPIKDETEESPAKTMIENRRDDVRSVYMKAPNLSPIRGTRWGALQAVVEYADHGRRFNNEQTQMVAQFGLNASGTEIKDRAFAILKDKKLKPVAA